MLANVAPVPVRTTAINLHTIPNYRADIDGLRAVAVFAVIMFHAGVKWFPGGFIGVDVFFVISGYLITGFILREKREGRFSLVSFYYRRARRIVPTLSIVLVATWVIGWWVLFPDEYHNLGKHMFAGAVFISNVIFWREAGYFDIYAEFKPLLHLWSLAIEEQFYCFWPITILAIWRIRGRVSNWLVLLLFASFGQSIWGVIYHPTSTFYLLPSRAWELLLGGWLASVESEKAEDAHRADTLLAREKNTNVFKSTAQNAASVVGIFLIAVSAILINRDSTFPGWAVLAPTLGTFLLIQAGPRALINDRVLARRPIVFMGLVSYCLYLWHWPLISFFRIVNLGELQPIHAASAIGLSFLLAILTWKFIEQPIRSGTFLRYSSVNDLSHGWRLTGYLGLLSLCGLLGITTYWLNGFPSRTSQAAANTLKASEWSVNPWLECLYLESKEFTPSELCRTSRKPRPTAAIIGDSHAVHYLPGIAKYLDSRGLAAIMLSHGNCGPFPGLRWENVFDCRDFTKETIEYVQTNNEIRTVIIAGRFALWAEGTGIGRERGRLSYRFRSDQYPTASSNRDIVASSLNNFVHQVTEHGKKIVFLLQVPEMENHIPKCYARGNEDCDIREPDVMRRQHQYREIIETINRRYPGGCIFDPLPHFCKEDVCRSKIDGKILYLDNNHLSLDGSYFVSPFFNFERCLR